MLSKNIRQIGVILVPILTPVVWYLLLVQRSFPGVTPMPTVLVSGDFTDTRSFAHAVFRRAQSKARSPEIANLGRFRVEKLDDQGDSNQDTFRQQFLDALARRHVVAVVSASTSQNAPALLGLTEAFRVPTLLAVPTTDRLLNAPIQHAIRLVPNDSNQGRVIADAAKAGKDIVALLYHPSEYGEFLSLRIASCLDGSGSRVVRTGFSRSSLSLETVLQLAKIRPKVIVYAGYYDDVTDLVRLLSLAEIAVPLFLSDGCLSPDLSKIAKRYGGPVYISFPVNPFGSPDGSDSGFGSYGADAAAIIAHALDYSRDLGRSRHELFQSIRDVLKDEVIDKKFLSAKYRYSKGSENEAAEFKVIEVPEATVEREQLNE